MSMHGGGRGVCAQIGPWRPQRRSTLLYLLLLLLVQIAAPSSDTLEDIDGECLTFLNNMAYIEALCEI